MPVHTAYTINREELNNLVDAGRQRLTVEATVNNVVTKDELPFIMERFSRRMFHLLQEIKYFNVEISEDEFVNLLKEDT